MENTLLTQLASAGLLGPIVIFLWVELRRTRDKLDAAQAQRVADAQEYADRMLTLSKSTKELAAALQEKLEREGGTP